MFFYNNVIKALKTGVSTVEELIKSMDGAFILEIYRVLLQIQQEETNPFSQVSEKLLSELSKEFDKHEYERQIEKINYLPIPHILDSDWRFTSNTTKFLCKYLKNILKPQNNLILIGVPSLFLLLNENKELVEMATLLIERNNIAQNMTGNPNIICGDIRNVRLYNCADVVLCDPPWYLDSTKYFLDAAQAMLHKDGILLMIVPPKGVRNSVEKEYSELINYADGQGLRFVEILNGALNYVTPPFEMNTIINAGVKSFPVDWRRGSMMVFTKKDTISKASTVSTELYQSEWLEVQVQNVRFKVRDYTDSHQLKPIEHLCKNDIYPTVSMQLNLKNDVNIWTSGNRVYRCKNPFLFRTALSLVQTQGFARNNIFAVLNKTEETMEYLDLIEYIVKTEDSEYAHYWSMRC